MRKILIMTGLAFLGIGAVAFGLGIVRYGGPQGLALRVKAEIQARVPQEQFLPTPLPTATRLASAATPTLVPLAPEPSVTEPDATRQEDTPTTSPARSATATDVPTPTVTPTRTATPTRRPTAIRTPAHRPAAPSVEMTGFTHMWQTWNNCGPASLAMDFSYYGLQVSQATAGTAIRPNSQDKHASGEELASYARSKGFRALARVNGSAEQLRLYLSNGIPVIVATWHINEKGVGMGHYRLATGYDDARREWIFYDSLESRGYNPKEPYRGIRLAYAEFDHLWAVMNYAYVVVYPDNQAAVVASILGDDADDQVMWQASLQRAEEAVQQRPNDVFAWFTLGTNRLGNGQPEDAAQAYDQARLLGLPYRMLWYQHGPLQAYYLTGRIGDLLVLTEAILETTGEVEEVHYWRGMGLLAAGSPSGARREFEIAAMQRPTYAEATAILAKVWD
jgi:hypothetical protein